MSHIIKPSWVVATICIAFALACGTSTDDDLPEVTETPVTIAPAAITPQPQANTSSAGDGPITITVFPPFTWPAEGPITSMMGPEHTEGIDIGLDTGTSKLVYAAARGTVIEAGGSDEDSLGLFVLIDHGNGITTTYGHLSELHVSVGDSVTTSETIGVGGSTGISSGDHLHFEVRKDGLTVDPFSVLPEQGAPAAASELECGEAFPIPAGARAMLDLRRFLSPGERLVSVTLRPQESGAPLESVMNSPFSVAILSPIDFEGPERLELHDLQFTIDRTLGNRTYDCTLAVQHRGVPTTFFVRAVPDGESVPESTSTPVPTPTPPPNQPQYNQPAFSDASNQTPQYDVPVGNSPQVAAPGFAIPGAPTATPGAQ